MAENREYVIVCKIEGGGTSSGSASAVAGASTPSSTASASSASSKGGILNQSDAKAYLGAMTAWHTVKGYMTQQINHSVSLVELRTGSNESQVKAQFINQIVQKGVGMAETTLTGALVGGLPGALVGLALSTSHTLIGYANQQETLYLKETLENRSIEMLRMRAGALGSRSNNQ